jgi:type I restriction enzyme S subunit
MTNTKLKVGNVPNLRFPGFVGEWEEKRLKDLGSFFSGGTPKTTNKDYYDGNIPFIRSGEIHFDTTELHISQDGLKNSSAKMINRGQILIALYGATSGEISISKIHGAINQAILCFDTKINRQFFKNLWQKHVDKILKSYLQGGQGNLSAEIIKQLAFDFPVKDEQTKIADFINKIEKYIETQSKIIEELETLIKGICQKLLFSQVSNRKLKDCVSCYSSSLTETDVINKTGTYPVFGATGIISFTENYQIDKDAILIIKDGSGVGKVQYGKDKFSVIGTLNYLTAKTDINLKYIFFYLKFFNFEKYKVGSGIPHIYFKDYGESYIYCPSLKEQHKTENLLSFIDEKINVEKVLLQKYEIKKKFLIQNLFICNSHDFI